MFLAGLVRLKPVAAGRLRQIDCFLPSGTEVFHSFFLGEGG